MRPPITKEKKACFKIIKRVLRLHLPSQEHLKETHLLKRTQSEKFLATALILSVRATYPITTTTTLIIRLIRVCLSRVQQRRQLAFSQCTVIALTRAPRKKIK